MQMRDAYVTKHPLLSSSFSHLSVHKVIHPCHPHVIHRLISPNLPTPWIEIRIHKTQGSLKPRAVLLKGAMRFCLYFSFSVPNYYPHSYRAHSDEASK